MVIILTCEHGTETQVIGRKHIGHIHVGKNDWQDEKKVKSIANLFGNDLDKLLKIDLEGNKNI